MTDTVTPAGSGRLVVAPDDSVTPPEPSTAPASTAPWRSSALLAVISIPVLSLGIPIVVVAGGLPRHGDVLGAYSLIGEVLLGVPVFWAAQRVARRSGGWQSAIGLTRPVRSDGSTVAAWSGIQLGVKFAVAAVLTALIPWMQHHHGGNLTGTGDLGAGGIAMLVASGVIVAPIVEEIAFRGVLLNAMMRRLSFWWAAVLSSLLFGALHAPTASALPALPVVVTWTAAFGVVQCILVRHTKRLTPAIFVHAIANLLAIGLALAVGS